MLTVGIYSKDFPYGSKVIILLDEYDTPIQEAYVDGLPREGNEPSDCLIGKFTTYWANTSSNSLVGKLLREGNLGVKEKFESLLLASGYLKVLSYDRQELLQKGQEQIYELTLTNYEVDRMFEGMVRSWFAEVKGDYNDFEKALLHFIKKVLKKFYIFHKFFIFY